jgi:hypothetical protein
MAQASGLLHVDGMTGTAWCVSHFISLNTLWQDEHAQSNFSNSLGMLIVL